MKPENGLTLLETVIVVALAAAVLGTFLYQTSGMNNQRKIETARGDLRVLQTAIHAYYLGHQSEFPPDTLQKYLINDDPQLLSHVLYDPFQKKDGQYLYYLSSNGKYYVIFSVGVDGGESIKSIDANGKLTGQSGDDIFVTNGTGTFAS